MNILEDINPEITKEQVCRLLGYGKGKRLSRQISSRINKYIERAYSLIKPQITYKEKKIKKIEKGSVMLEENLVLNSSRLSKSLKKCDRATVFLATIGKEIDYKINTLMKQKSITDAYIFDAIGSIAVEETVDVFQKRFDVITRTRKESTTLRFSPGYCDWPVQEQKKIFQIIDNTLIDVQLSSSCLMIPRKSISGIFGIGNLEEIGKVTTNPCNLCRLQNCIARRTE